MSSVEACQLGLVGCGRWGKFILRDLVNLGCQVRVVARDPLSQSTAWKFGAVKVVENISELPDHLDGYVVATPTATHYDVISGLAERGKPIYCEKPVTNDVATAETIASRWGHLVFVMDKWRYHPAIEQMRLWADSGKLGRLKSIRTRRMQWGSPHTDVDAPWILLPHDLSIVRHILGELPDIRWCIGQEIDGQVCSVTALLAGDVDCLLEASTFSPVTHRRVELVGEKGAVILDDSDYGQLLWNHAGSLSYPREPEIFKLSTSLPLAAELEAFVDYLQKGGEAPLTNAVQGLESVTYISQMIDMVRCRSSQ